MIVRKFRVGLVGAGHVSEPHIQTLTELRNVRIVGITDLDLARAKATGLPTYPSLRAMAAEGLDVVHVLTPPGEHATVALEALDLGCHVFVEKPLATSVEDCDRLAAAAEARGLCVGVDHSLLADPIVRRALALVRSGAIGRAIAVEYLRSSDYPPYRGGAPPPHYQEGGYPFRDLGVHGLYLVQEILGEILDVQSMHQSSGLKDRDPNIQFDEWRALVRCARGTGGIQLSWNARPLQHRLIVQGTRGALRADLFSRLLARHRETRLPKAVERGVNAFAEVVSSSGQLVLSASRFMGGGVRSYQGVRNFVRAYYEALEAGLPTPSGIAEARPIVHWTERVARAADADKARSIAPYRSGRRPAVVVTGANGHLGRALVDRLVRNGESVRLFVRRLPSENTLHHPRIEVVLGDLGDPLAADRAITGATTVFHVGAALHGVWEAHEAATIVGTRNVVDACLSHRIPKLIHISSLSVIDCAGHPAGAPVTETAPLEPSPERRGFYTRAKLEAERIVRAAAEERGLPAVIVRPGLIWSEHNPPLTAAVGVRMGRRLFLVGDPSIHPPLVHVDDVVEGVLGAARSPHKDGRTYHLIGDDPITREELAALHARGREPRLAVVHLPLAAALLLARAGEFLFGVLGRSSPVSSYRLRSAYAALEFDCRKAREELGWEPRAQGGAALRECLRDLALNGL